MSPKYFYEYMHITDMEPAEPIIIPKGADIKPKSAETLQCIVEVQKPVQPMVHVPDMKPIEYHGFDLNTTIGTILFYLKPKEENMQLLYKTVMFLQETRSFIFVTNRPLSEWDNMGVDPHTASTFRQRISSGAQIIHLG